MKENISTTPWSIGAAMADGSVPITDSDGCIVALVQPAIFNSTGQKQSEDRQALNARLLLAAPGMLQGLRDIRRQSLGDDWTAVQAIEFAKQHAKELVAPLADVRLVEHDEPLTRYFAVSGRFHGDDEATTLTFEAASRDDAVVQFKEAICALSNLTSDQVQEVLSDDPPERMQVYIDAVLCSATKIEEV